MQYLILFVLGAIVGSFLNVVGLRWDSGITLGGRSHCLSCRQKLRWWELVPVFSFVYLRGQCARCKSKISWQYPLIELWTGLVFVSIYYLLSNIYSELNSLFLIHFSLFLVIFSIYTVILIYDMRHKIIPDELVYTAIVLSLIIPTLLTSYSLIDWLAGPIIFSFFGLIWLLSKGRAMGFGDAKLGASVGFLLGAGQGFSAIVLAFWIGTIVTLSYMFIARVVQTASGSAILAGGRGLTMKSEVPFGPYIVIGALLALVLKLDLLHVTLF